MTSLKKLYTLFVAALTIFAVVSCESISEENRYIPISPVNPTPGHDSDSIVRPVAYRAVLIEDYTGQQCLNCPNATDEIERLIEIYGDSIIIPVGIHSGGFGVSGVITNALGSFAGYKTDLGQRYYDHFGIESQPSGNVDRQGVSEYNQWNNYINRELQKPVPCMLTLNNTYDAATRQLTVKVSAIAQDPIQGVSGKLQLWLVEDGLVSFQKLPSGSINTSYTHNHVLRDAINGDWGTDISVVGAEPVEQTFTYTLPVYEAPQNWTPEHISIVAFIYNDNGVQQVTRKKIIQ